MKTNSKYDYRPANCCDLDDIKIGLQQLKNQNWTEKQTDKQIFMFQKIADKKNIKINCYVYFNNLK